MLKLRFEADRSPQLLMYSPPLELVNEQYLCISGDVVVHPGAVIAPGVLLQADPGSQLIIEAGVCIGQGSVLHAHQGTLVLETGAVLGNGVLIVGRGTIGTRACIGSMTTILSCSIPPHQIIPPYSLLGDASRQISLENPEPSPDSEAQPESVSSPPEPQPLEAVADSSEPAPKPELPDGAVTNPEPPSQEMLKQVYGQAYVERMIIAMFPHRRTLNAALNPADPADPTPPSAPEDPPPSR
jgi:carbon dioxide concentrating mechanism protein CcmN